VICDGMLWDSCAEPCYEYSSGSWSVPPYFKVVFAYPERLEKPDGLVRADGMEQWLLDWEGTKAGAEPLEISGRIDVLMPQVLKLSVAGPTLVGRATRAVSSMEGHLKEYDVATFSSYAALRDALSASGGKATEDLVSAIDAVLETPAMAERVGHIRLAEARERFRREMSGAAAEAPATRRQGR
jgi:hypothetical protein